LQIKRSLAQYTGWATGSVPLRALPKKMVDEGLDVA